MNRFKIVVGGILLASLLTGCSRLGFKPTQTAVEVKNDGSIKSTIMDTLDKDYYDVAELEAEIDSAITTYNSTAGGEGVQKDSLENEDGNLTVKLTFNSGNDYAAFNELDFYVGDIEGAYNGGYRFEAVFDIIEEGLNTGTSLTSDQLLQGLNYEVVVLSEEMEVKVPGEILYVSDNVEVTGKTTAKVSFGAAETEAQTEVQTEAETETETDTETQTADGVTAIAPSEEIQGDISAEEEAETEAVSTIAYIIYE